MPIHLHLHFSYPAAPPPRARPAPQRTSPPPLPWRGESLRGERSEAREAQGVGATGSGGCRLVCALLHPGLLSTSSTSRSLAPTPGSPPPAEACAGERGAQAPPGTWLGVSGASGPSGADPRAARALPGGRGRRRAARSPQCLRA